MSLTNTITSLLGKKRSKTSQRGVLPDNPNEPAQLTIVKTLALVFDPVVENGRKLSQVLNSHRPEDLVTSFMSDILNASGGMARYQITQRFDVDEFPAKVDGFKYTPQSYMDVLRGIERPHDPHEAEYQAILNRFNILQKIAKGEVDEMWIFSFPHAGFYGSVMCGPEAYWCNAPPIKNTDASKRKFIVMGFDCERGAAEMLEAFGHRVEAIMERTFEGLAGESNLWDRFTRSEKIAPNKAACGTIRFAPNSQTDYDLGNQIEVLSECDDWLENFPHFKGSTKKVNASKWGNGDIHAHHTWWLSHIPKTAGRRNGIHHNWWQYIMNPNYA